MDRNLQRSETMLPFGDVSKWFYSNKLYTKLYLAGGGTTALGSGLVRYVGNRVVTLYPESEIMFAFDSKILRQIILFISQVRCQYTNS